jgi:uncharacterized protein (TIGR00290 family)
VKKPTLLAWSSGKDCAWALHLLRQSPDVELTGLFCTINEVAQRVAMHAVRLELLRQQALHLGLPLRLLPIPYPCSNEQYETIMGDFVREARRDGIECLAFGDLFLEDIRRYREEKMADSGLKPLFPLWGRATDRLAREMIEAGLRARVTCVDPKVLPAEFAGRNFDAGFLKDLPPGVDPCGENGEFHTFVFGGPMFQSPLAIRGGSVVQRDGFVFADVMPV